MADAPLYQEVIDVTQEQVNRAIEILDLLDQVKVKLILLQTSGDYINLTSAKNKLNSVIAEIEDIIYPSEKTLDIETLVMRHDGKQEVRL